MLSARAAASHWQQPATGSCQEEEEEEEKNEPGAGAPTEKQLVDEEHLGVGRRRGRVV